MVRRYECTGRRVKFSVFWNVRLSVCLSVCLSVFWDVRLEVGTARRCAEDETI
jgi:hypothetical protein